MTQQQTKNSTSALKLEFSFSQLLPEAVENGQKSRSNRSIPLMTGMVLTEHLPHRLQGFHG